MKEEPGVTLVSFHQREPSPSVRVSAEAAYTCPFALVQSFASYVSDEGDDGN
jgi:hypothetical protein